MAVNDDAGQEETTEGPDASQISQDGTEVPEGQDTSDGQDTDGQDDTDDGNPNYREARYRVERNEARAERDELRDSLERTRQSIVDNAVQAAGLDPRLLSAAGHSVDTLVGEDGLIDRSALAEAIAATKREFRVSPGLLPNPQQWGYSGPARLSASESWTKAFGPSRQ